jgi:hypothetical protein
LVRINSPITSHPITSHPVISRSLVVRHNLDLIRTQLLKATRTTKTIMPDLVRRKPPFKIPIKFPVNTVRVSMVLYRTVPVNTLPINTLQVSMPQLKMLQVNMAMRQP